MWTAGGTAFLVGSILYTIGRIAGEFVFRR